MENITIDNFLPVVIYAIIVHFLIPTAKSMFPANQQAKIKKDAMLTEAAIELDRRDADRKDREVQALEGINKNLTISNERLSSIEASQTKILSNLQGQTNALTVLVDRQTRQTKKRTT